MRTTVSIDDQLLIEVKTIAAQSGRTLSAVIEDALRASMGRRAERGSAPSLPTISGGGLQPGVDLDDSAALLDLMEGTSR
jgi:Arc/MetJ family transcription regulator